MSLLDRSPNLPPETSTIIMNKFRLFKRDDQRKEIKGADGPKDHPYYFRFVHRGRAYLRCLETNDATEAQRRAKLKYAEIVSAVSTGEYKRLDATKLRAGESTGLEQLYTAYRTGPSEANVKTREVNINALKQLAQGHQNPTISTLSPALAREWFANTQQAVLKTSDQEAAASLKRSANSRWAQAKSLFTDRCLSHYQDLDLIPSPAALQSFVAAGNAARFNRIPKQNYNPPSEQIIAATLAAWEGLEDRHLFLAIGHELSFGLRLAEMAQARWNWHTIRNDYPVLDGRAQVKNGSGLVQVRALDPYYTTLRRIAAAKGWWGAGEEPIITGTMTYRTDDLFRAVSTWLRALGWETMKTNHALRAFAGSQVAMRYGIYEAQIFLRHSTVKVTEQNYSHFVSKFKPSDLSTIPARWAKVTSQTCDVTLDVTADYRKIVEDRESELPWITQKRN